MTTDGSGTEGPQLVYTTGADKGSRRRYHKTRDCQYLQKGNVVREWPIEEAEPRFEPCQGEDCYGEDQRTGDTGEIHASKIRAKVREGEL